jgi:hypothetical protein
MLKHVIAACAAGFCLAGCLLAYAHSPGQPKPTKPPTQPAKPTAPAATQAKPIKPTKGRLDASEPSKPDLSSLRQLRTGDEMAVTGAARTPLLKKVTQWYIYRLTWAEIYDANATTSLRHVFDEATSTNTLIPNVGEFTDPPVAKRQLEYFDALSVELAAAFREVMKNPNVIVRLNAMRLAARFAELGVSHLAPLFTEVLEKGESGGVLYWAVHGLGELFEAANRKPKQVNIDPKAREAAGMSLYRFLLNAMQFQADTLAQMTEDEKDAIRFVRRATIRALGAIRRPAIIEEGGKREGPAAELLLLTLLGDSKVQPSVSWLERAEAAVALLALNPAASATYQPDPAAFEVARFVVLISDRAAADSKDGSWRHYGMMIRVRLLDNEKADGVKRNAYYNEMVKVLVPALEQFIPDKPMTKDALEKLNNWIEKSPPKVTTIWKAAG